MLPGYRVMSSLRSCSNLLFGFVTCVPVAFVRLVKKSANRVRWVPGLTVPERVPESLATLALIRSAAVVSA